VLPSNCFVRNTGQPTAVARLYVNRIEQDGYRTALVNNYPFITIIIIIIIIFIIIIIIILK
jgi:hypothetical protein